MGELQLPFGCVISAFAIAKKLGDAENCRKRVVQLMGYAREHLAHGGKLLGLDELFFQSFEIGNVTAGENHALDIPVFIGQRTEIETNPSPISQFVAYANFQRSEVLPAGDNVLVKGYQGGQILRVSASAELHLVGLIHFVT